MGGTGFGQAIVQKRQKVVEDCASISITELQQHGVFTTSKRTEWSPQTPGGQPVMGGGLLQVIAHAAGNLLILVASYLDGRRQMRVATETVTLSWSACHFGGKRPWFVCPGPVDPVGTVEGAAEGAVDRKACGGRVTKLYLTEQVQLRCRACAGLAYRSDHLTPPERPLHEARKILRRLGGSGSLTEGFPERPKGMHFDIWHSAGWRVHNLLAEHGRLSIVGLEELFEAQNVPPSDPAHSSDPAHPDPAASDLNPDLPQPPAAGGRESE